MPAPDIHEDVTKQVRSRFASSPCLSALSAVSTGSSGVNGCKAVDRIWRKPPPVRRLNPACFLLGGQDDRIDRMGSLLGLVEAAQCTLLEFWNTAWITKNESRIRTC